MKKHNQAVGVILCVPVLAFVCLTLVSCSKEKPATSKIAISPPSFENETFSEITPMLDGSAYATSWDSGLWYLRGNKAVKVKALTNSSQELPEFSEITPVLDGGAYATSLDSGLWYLRENNAEKVAEVASLVESTAPINVSSNAFYALYLSEHKKRKDAEYRADNPAEFAEPSDVSDDSDY